MQAWYRRRGYREVERIDFRASDPERAETLRVPCVSGVIESGCTDRENSRIGYDDTCRLPDRAVCGRLNPRSSAWPGVPLGVLWAGFRPVDAYLERLVDQVGYLRWNVVRQKEDMARNRHQPDVLAGCQH